MSTPFPLEDAAQLERQTPVDPWKGPVQPRWYSGLGYSEDNAYMGPFVRAAGHGAALGEQLMAGNWHAFWAGTARLAEAVNAPGAPMIRRIERGLTDVQADADERVKALTPDPTTTGAAAQTIHGLVSGAYRVGVGSLAGGPVAGALFLGGTAAKSRYQDLRDQGVDEYTARRAATLEGITSTLGAAVPAGYGTTLLTRLATGAASNMGFGLVNRYADHAILKDAGYPEMADQQGALDATQLLTDGLLGAAFGGLSHAHARPGAPLARDVPGVEDAALTANLALRDRALAPGVAVDPQAANAHDAALRTATSQLLSGQKVDVAGTGVDTATFARRPAPEPQDAQQALFAALKDSPVLEEEAALGRLEVALGARLRGEKPTEEPQVAPVAAERELLQTKMPEAVRGELRAGYADAERGKPAFDENLSAIAKEIGASQEPQLPPLKGVARAVDKALGEKGGDASQVHDLLRGTIVADTVDQAQRALELAQQRFGGAIGLRNGLTSGAPAGFDGYRDIKFNVANGGHLAEVQINLPEMLKAKERAHKLYEQQRAIDGRAAREQRQVTTEEAAKQADLLRRQREIYDTAWGRVLARERKVVSESTVPLRATEEKGKGLPSATSQAVALPPGSTETGTPSTSANSVPTGNEAGSAKATGVTSSEIIPERRAAGAGPDIVSTATGRQIAVQPKLVELEDILTSDKEGYPAELQPRQRGGRKALEEQVRTIAQNLAPERLGASAEADRGAPITGPKNVVESGNGRVLALRQVYEGNPEKAQAYRDFLKSQGYDTEGMKQPVLVRERVTELSDAERRAFTVEANQAATAALSPVERAQADARQLDSGVLAQLRSGDLSTAQNAPFVRAFMERVPQSERNALVNPDGTVSQEGVRRLQAAILAKAYGGAAESNAVLGRMLESTDTDMRSTMGALLDAAPAFAKLREAIAEGKVGREYDIARALTQAVETTAAARSRGQALQEHLSQGDLYTRRSEVVQSLARALYDKKGERLAGREAVAQRLMNYADQALKQRLDQGMLFADAPLRPEALLAAGEPKAEAAPMRPAADMFGLRAPQGKAPVPVLRVAEEALGRSPNLELPSEESPEPVRGRAELLDAGNQVSTTEERAPGALETAANCAGTRPEAA